MPRKAKQPRLVISVTADNKEYREDVFYLLNQAMTQSEEDHYPIPMRHRSKVNESPEGYGLQIARFDC